MTYDAGARKDVRRAEKTAAIAARDRIDFIRNIMGSTSGRAFFHDLLESCHMFAEPFTGEPIREAFLKGERTVGLRLFADIIREAPDQYILMMREASIRSTTNGRRNDDTSPSELGGSADAGRDAEGSDSLNDYRDETGRYIHDN